MSNLRSSGLVTAAASGIVVVAGALLLALSPRLWPESWGALLIIGDALVLAAGGVTLGVGMWVAGWVVSRTPGRSGVEPPTG